MTNVADHTKFQSQYLSVRKKEGRLYSDEDVKRLPEVSTAHPLKKEWMARKHSAERLRTYLRTENAQLNILEIGCGNGWLCNYLSAVSGFSITGMDVNETELLQAKRLFPSVQFLSADIREATEIEMYDVIVFAASVQYFKSLEEILDCCLGHLRDGGEIHILDTHFYSEKESLQAEIRSFEYFAMIGFPEMNDFYFHHTFTDLRRFNHRVLYDPKILLNKLVGKNPFPWICIKK